MEGIRRALVLGLVLIAGNAIEQAPSVGPMIRSVVKSVKVPVVVVVRLRSWFVSV